MMALKANEKAVSSAVQGPSLSKIPVPLKSPRKKSVGAPKNNIICSTPLNTVKLHLFSDENQQMSPIHNPCSATPSDNNSLTKVLDAAQELKSNSQITKIKTDNKKKPAKFTQIRKDAQESDYIFPLVNSVPVLKMTLCDSEEETLPKKSKRGRKPIVINLSSNEIETELKKTKSKISNKNNAFETIAIIENRELIQTRSKTENNVSENDRIKQKNRNAETKNDRSSPKSKKLKTSTNKSSNKQTKATLNKNKNARSNEDVALLTARMEKIKKDIINDKTKNSLNLKISENKNNIENNHYDIFSTLNLKNNEDTKNIVDDIFITKTEKAHETVTTDSKFSLNSNTNTRRKKKEIEFDELSIKKSTTIQKLNNSDIPLSKKRGRPTKAKNSSQNSNKADNNTTNSNNTAETSNNVNIKNSQVNKNEPIKTKNSNIDENCQGSEIRRSERKRIPSSKYWINRYRLPNEDLNGQMEDEFKKPSLMSRRLQKPVDVVVNLVTKTQDTPNIDEHCIEPSETKNIHKLETSISKRSLRLVEAVVDNKSPKNSNNRKETTKTQDTPNTDEHCIVPNETKNIHKLETSISKRSLRLVEAVVDNKSPTNSNNKKEIPRTLQEPHVVEKSKTRSLPVTKTSEKNKLYEYSKYNLSRQSLQCNRRQSFRKSRINESKILTAGKIRKSLALEKKIATPKKITKMTTNLQASAKNTSYTTEEENDIPRDTSYTTEEENGIPRDTLLLNNAKHETTQILSPHGMKRKVESNAELCIPKKVRLQTENEFSFKKMAVLVDISPAKAGGLADVQIRGKRCLLGCFGKFPRHCTTNSHNSDISVGISVNNNYITTGILEIEPDGKKKYEYAKKVDLLFLVLEGIAEVGIGNSSQVLRLGQDFYVPKDTPYYILNISNTSKLLLYFSKFSR